MNSKHFRTILNAGLITGIVIFYTAVVGLVGAFNERELIRDYLTMSQVMIFVPALVGGAWLANRELPTVTKLVGGLLVGLIAALPVLALTYVAYHFDVRDIFTNIYKGLGEILTLQNGSPRMGSLILTGIMMGLGLLGALMSFVPSSLRSLLYSAFVATLLVALLAEYLNTILETILEFFGFSDDLLDPFFRRNTLKLTGALTVFGIALLVNGINTSFGKNIQQGFKQLPVATRRSTNGLGLILFAMILIILPWVAGRFLSDAMTTVGLYMLMGLGLNIAIGMAGLLDLGYVTNFAVGAYLVGLLTSQGPQGIGGGVFNLWLAIPLALLAAMLTGFIFALPVLKMRGDYLAIATLGFGEIIGKLANSDALEKYIGGAAGLKLIPKPYFFNIEIVDPEQFYYVVLVAVIVMLFVTWRLINSRIGRQWTAIREDEDVAAAMGIDTARSKLLAFTISAAIGGVAGAIFASKVGAAFPNSFTLLVSLNVLALIIVGGMGSISGVLVGALVLMGLPEILREFSEYRFLVYGILLVWMMLQRPEGFIPSTVARRERGDDVAGLAGAD